MRTLVLDPVPAEIQQLIERRRKLGQDLFDEIWEGTYHMAPAPRGRHGYLDIQLAVELRHYAEAAGLVGTGPVNIGEADDYRVPDQAYHRQFDPEAIYFPTAALVVEIMSPGDETYDKLPFYAAHNVDEVLIADPAERSLRVLARRDQRYEDSEQSKVLGFEVQQLRAAIRWP
ncbi:MAG: Uma2 family endonuclease [Actinobacteria bacterium]|nr:Uma2 family endonuclease [Actinomycetota bacterium]